MFKGTGSASPNSTALFVGAPGANRVYAYTSASCGAAWNLSSTLTGADTAAGDAANLTGAASRASSYREI